MFRIATNYLRMGASFFLALLLVRFLIDMDEGIYAVIVLLGTTVGISGMMKEVVRAAMIAEVGLAYHENSGERFQQTYSTAFVISIAAGLAACGILGFFYFFLDKLSIRPELLSAAAYYLGWRAVHTFISITFAPTTNMLVITKKMGMANFWMTLERVAEVLVAFLVLTLMTDSLPAVQLRAFAFYGTLAMLFVDACWIVSSIAVDTRFVPSVRHFSKEHYYKIRGTIGWNGFVVAAMNLYSPLVTIVVNVVFGVSATVVFGLAIQLLNYIRIPVMGLVFGLDAVFTSKTDKSSSSQGEIVSRITRLQSLIVLGACTFGAINIEAIFQLWVGSRLSNPQVQIPQAGLLFSLLMVGIVARSITEGWMKYLSGIGEVRAYGPLLLKGAIFNPPLMFLLITSLPQEYAIFGPAIAFSSLLFVVHLVFLPNVVSRFLDTGVLALLQPVLLPLLLNLLAAVLSWLASQYVVSSQGTAMMISLGIYAVLLVPYFMIELFKLREND